ncbi:MAG: outer membrane beta-barrel protein [Flavobacteriales bacterium]
MRTKILTFLLAVGVSASAQELRLSGGYNGSNINEVGDEKWVGRAGYQFGADLLLGKRWIVKGGAHFMVRNINYSVATIDDQGNPTENVTEFRYTSQFLKVPIHAGFRFIDPEDEPVVNAYIIGGPTALFKLKADLDNDAIDVNTAPVHWYLGAGAGIQFGPVFVEGGYDVAMNNVFEGDNFNTNPKVNQVYALVGVRLKLADD